MAIFPRQILKYWNHDDGIRINLFAVPKSELLLRKYYLSRKYKHIKITSRFLFLMQIYASFILIVAGSTFHENITSLSNLDNFKLYMVFINGFVSGLVSLNILRQHKIKSVDISKRLSQEDVIIQLFLSQLHPQIWILHSLRYEY